MIVCRRKHFLDRMSNKNNPFSFQTFTVVCSGVLCKNSRLSMLIRCLSKSSISLNVLVILTALQKSSNTSNEFVYRRIESFWTKKAFRTDVSHNHIVWRLLKQSIIWILFIDLCIHLSTARTTAAAYIVWIW